MRTQRVPGPAELGEPGVRGNQSPSYPVNNKAFMKALRKAAGVPIGLPAPAAAVRFGAHNVFRTDPELALYGRYVVPERLLAEGFSFRFRELASALRDLV